MAAQESNGMRYFVMGVIAGAIGGVLLAPKPGVEMREDLADYTERGKGFARRFLDRLSAKASTASRRAEHAATEAYREAV